MGKSVERRFLRAPASVTATAFTSASSAAVAVGGGSGKRALVLSPSSDCYVKFGISTVGVATAGDVPLTAGQDYYFWVVADVTHYRVVRKSADGTLVARVS